MTPPDPHSLAPLLQEMGWLSRLARELVRDPHSADDAVQETLTVAVEQRPDTSRPARGWLATILRNVVRQERRSARRRSGREERGARAESLPSASELASKVELSRRLAAAVLALREPQRSTIVLRFFEELPPREIARAQGVPLATVKSRLQRGLAELRTQLDGEARLQGGDGRSWILALAPLVRPPLEATHALPWTSSLTIGAVAMKAKILVACALVAALLVFVLLRSGDAPKPAVEREIPRAEAPLETPTPERANTPTEISAVSERALVATPPPTGAAPASEAPAAVETTNLSGVVFDSSGAVLPNLRVRAEPADEKARADAHGRFTFPGKQARSEVVLDEPEYVTVLAGGTAASTRDSVVVGARAVSPSGRIVDPSGEPVGGVQIAFELLRGFRGRFPVVVDESTEKSFAARADDDGRFKLSGWPAVSGAKLQLSRAGYHAAELDMPLADDAELRVTLVPLEAPRTGLRGRVVDALGAPVEGALVAWGRRTVESGKDGGFAFDDDPRKNAKDARAIVAVHAGSLPGRVDALADDANGRPTWPEPLVVALGGPPLSIRGRVEAADGTPRANVRVWANSFEYIGEHTDPSGEPNSVYVESQLAGAPGWNPVRTDEQGRFEIPGLCARDYDITALDDGSAQRVDVSSVHAGASGVVLRFTRDALFDEVSGRVVDKSGRGVPRVQVRVTTDCFSQAIDGDVRGTWHESGAQVETDAEGRFTLHGMPRERAYLRFSGEDVLSTMLGRGERQWMHGTSGIVVTVVRRCHFQVQLREPGLADRIELLDRQGGHLDIVEFVGNGSITEDEMKLVDGKSSTLAASEEASVLVLKKDGKEISRIPIALQPGELTVLRP